MGTKIEVKCKSCGYDTMTSGGYDGRHHNDPVRDVQEAVRRSHHRSAVADHAPGLD